MSSTAQMEDELALVSVNESNSATYDILLKIMALGDTGVGKSCFLVQVIQIFLFIFLNFVLVR